MADWLSAPMSNEVFTLIFGIQMAVCLVFGLHALIVARMQRQPGERAWNSLPFWLGMKLLVADTITAGTFAMFFFLGMATLTGIGVLIYLPGMLATVGAFVVWARFGGAR